MFDQFATLNCSSTVPAHVERSPVSAVESSLTLAASALAVLQDFRRHAPAVLPERSSVEQAMSLFHVLGVRHVLVEDAEGDFQGILTADAVLGPRRMVQMRMSQLLPHEMSVRDLMIPRQQLLSVPWRLVVSACVGDVLHTLEVSDQRFLCVVDAESRADCRLRGLFCARDIGERLGLTWLPQQRARTFSQVHASLREQADLAFG